MMLGPTFLLSLIAGALALLFGRRLYWLFVGVAGFTAGLALAEQLPSASLEARLFFGIVAGVVLAVLVLALQKPVLAIGGFLAFGVAGTVLLRLLGLRPDASVTVLAFFVAGIIGAALVFIVFDWALIVISSLNGATTIVGTLVSAGVARVGTFGIVIVVGLLLIGIAFQAQQLRHNERSGG